MTLLERSSRRVTLTPAGETLQAEGAAALEAVTAAVRRTRRAGGTGPRLVLALKPGGDGGGLLPALLAAYEREPGALPVEMLLGYGADRALRDGRADAALLYTPRQDATGLATEPLLEEPQVAVLPASHRLAGRAEVSMADLDGETLPRALERPGGPVVGDGGQLMQLIALGRAAAVLPASMRGCCATTWSRYRSPTRPRPRWCWRGRRRPGRGRWRRSCAPRSPPPPSSPPPTGCDGGADGPARSGGRPGEEGVAPGDARAEPGEQHRVAAAQQRRADGPVQGEGDAGGADVADVVPDDRQLPGVQAGAGGQRGDQPRVGLVGDDQGQVGGFEAAGLGGLGDQPGKIRVMKPRTARPSIRMVWPPPARVSAVAGVRLPPAGIRTSSVPDPSEPRVTGPNP